MKRACWALQFLFYPASYSSLMGSGTSQSTRAHQARVQHSGPPSTVWLVAHYYYFLFFFFFFTIVGQLICKFFFFFFFIYTMCFSQRVFIYFLFPIVGLLKTFFINSICFNLFFFFIQYVTVLRPTCFYFYFNFSA